MANTGLTIGIVGGGQLGRMMALAAKEMGFTVGVLDPTGNCPAAQVADWHVVAPYDDVAALREMADKADVLTYEFENVDADALDVISAAISLPQGTDLLRITQDRRSEKRFLTDVGIPVAPYEVVDAGGDVSAAAAKVGFPCVLKTARGGYDGKGQIVLRSSRDVPAAQDLANRADCVLESFVTFTSEMSVIVVGDGEGRTRTFPGVGNEHRNNILHRSMIPAPVEEVTAQAADALARIIASELGLVGALAIEMFCLPGGGVVVNELAPRPHNSGHVTIEACDFNQFDMHIRAVVGWPLPKPRLLSPAIMVNLLGEHMSAVPTLIDDHPEWHFHLYGKATSKVGRKMGHVTILGDPAANDREVQATNVW